MHHNSTENNFSPGKSSSQLRFIPPDFFERLADLVPQLIVLLNSSREITYYNKRWSDFSQAHNFNAEPQKWYELIHPDYILHFEKQCISVLESQQERDFEIRIKRHDGSFRWHSVTLVHIQNPETASAFLMLSFSDIHEHKTILLDNEAVFKQLNDSYFILDSDWNITSANFEAERYNGKSCSDLLNKNFWSVFPNSVDSSLSYWDECHKAYEKRIHVTFEEFYPPDKLWIKVSAHPNSLGGISIFSQDITLSREHANALTESELRFRTATEASCTIIWVTDAEGKFIEEQIPWETYTGQNFSQYSGFGWAEALHPDDKASVQLAWAKAILKAERQTVSGRIWHNLTKSYRRFEAVAIPLKNRDGSLKEWVGSVLDIEDKKKAEDKLKASEERFRQIAEVMPHMVWTAFPDGSVDFLNSAWPSFTGKCAAELKQGQWSSCIHSKNLPLTLELWSKSLKEELPYEAVYRIQNGSDGTFRWFVSRGIPVRDDQNQVTMWYLCNADIHEQKCAQEKLFSLLMQLPAAVLILRGPTHICELANPTALQLVGGNSVLGKPLHEVTGINKSHMIIPHEVYESGVAQVVKEVAFSVSPTLNSPGETRYFDAVCQPLKDVYGNIEGVLAFATDVTESILNKRRFEKVFLQQLESEAKFRRIADSNMIGIIIWDDSGKILDANEKFLNMIAYSKTDLINEDIRWDKMTPPEFENLDKRALEDLEKNGVSEVFEKEFIDKNGKRIPIMMGVARFLNSKNRGIGFVLDIHQLKKTENELQRAIKTRDEFLTIASHELKTPLTSLSLQIQLHKRKINSGQIDYFTPEKISKMLSDDERQIKRLIRLIEDMLDVSRITSGKLTINPQEDNLTRLTTEVLEHLKPQLQAAGNHVNLSLPPQALACYDTYRIEQVLINLLTNAMRYAPNTPIYISIENHLNNVVLVVRDEGPGIAKEDQKRIFKRYERAAAKNKVSGLGIGLYISRQIIERHQGTLTLKSEIGHGATFTVTLPKHIH